MRFLRTIAYTVVFGLLVSTCALFASALSGTIDPSNVGYRYVRILNDPGFGTNNLTINFGKFSTQSQYNVTIDNTGLHGYAWGTLAGWIVMDCANTAGGCRTANGSFHVAVDSTGLLSGYAWGENTGWINFGPFTNTAIPRVQINSIGLFGGNSGNAGYAWSENFGWIVFDCSNGTNCLETDYRPQQVQPIDINKISAALPATQTSPTPPYCQTHPTDQICRGYIAPAPYAPPLTQPLPPPTPAITDYDELNSPELNYPNTPSTTHLRSRPSRHTSITDNGLGGIVIPVVETSPTPPKIVSTIPPRVWTSSTAVTPTQSPTTKTIEASFVTQVRAVMANLSDIVTRVTDGIRTMMALPRAQMGAKAISVLGAAVSAAIVSAIALLAPIAGMGTGLLPLILSTPIIAGFATIPAGRKWGVVIDAGVPLALARITLHDPSGAVVATTTTTKDGSFAFKHLAGGTYTATVMAGESSLSVLEGGAITVGANGTPEAPLTLSVAGAAETVQISPVQHFLVSHEVTLTNIALTLFGAGFLAALLSLIFYPSLTTALIVGVYGVIALLRTIGLFGSHASVFLNRVTGLPLAGTEITLYDAASHTPLFSARTSRFGRAYIPLEEGTYYIGTKASGAGIASEAVSAPTHAGNGYLRKRFFI